jgi:SAM-dependent methyltransferase
MNWRAFWNERAVLPNRMAAAGRSSTTDLQLIALVEDVRRKLGLGESSTVLDVGCGNGILRDKLAPSVRRYVGLDIAEEQLRRASGLRVQGAAERLPFSDGSFSSVLGTAVLQYLDSASVLRALCQARRVLKPGGAALFAMNPWSFRKQAYEQSTPASVSEESRRATEAAHWFSPSWLLGAAIGAGFANCKVLEMDETVWQAWYMFDLVCYA